jgi:hypothetical protein
MPTNVRPGVAKNVAAGDPAMEMSRQAEDRVEVEKKASLELFQHARRGIDEPLPAVRLRDEKRSVMAVGIYPKILDLLSRECQRTCELIDRLEFIGCVPQANPRPTAR